MNLINPRYNLIHPRSTSPTTYLPILATPLNFRNSVPILACNFQIWH